MNQNRLKKLGAFGEAKVAQALIDQNWAILARNYRHVGTEIDIIASKAGTLVFVEVKTTTGQSELGNYLERLLPHKKIKSLSRGVSHYIQEHATPAIETIRLDLAVVRVDQKLHSTIQWWANAAEILVLN